MAPEQIMDQFTKHYLDQKEPYHFKRCKVEDQSETGDEYSTRVIVVYTDHGVERTFEATGNGPLDAVQRGLEQELGISIKILDYTEHALREGANANAAAYIHILDKKKKIVTYGVGVSSNITRASIRAIFSAVNRIEAM